MRGRGREREWRYGNQNRNRREVTFFVANLPEEATITTLWKEFKKFGSISDAYVAKKKDVGGNYFGFVRMVGITNLSEVLKGMNEVKIQQAKVQVSLAKYDKNNQKLSHEAGGLHANPRRPVTKQSGQNFDPSTSRVQPGKSYRDTTGYEKIPDKVVVGKSINVEGEGPLYPRHRLGRSIIGVAKDLRALCNTRRMLEEGGYKDAVISYIGGFKVLVTVKDPECARVIVRERGPLWSNIWEDAWVWNGEDIPLDRIVCIKVTGAPLLLTEDSLFDRVGSLFGRVIRSSDFSWENTDWSEGTCHVLTTQMPRIDEYVNLLWKGKSYRIWVSEVKKNWSPTFYGMEESEVGQSEDQNSQRNEEWEEGEVRMEDSPENEDVQNPAEFQQTARGESLRVHGDSMEVDKSHGEVGNSGGIDGAEYTEVGPINQVGDGYCGPSDPPPTPFGPEGDNGPNFISTLGKRGRVLRSPPSEGSTQGPTVRMFQPHTDNRLHNLDLNSPPPVRLSCSSPVGSAAQGLGEEGGSERPSAQGLGEEGGSERPSRVNVEPREGAQGSDTTRDGGLSVDNQVEIDLTIRAGSLIGVQLGGFEGQVKELVIEDGEQVVSS